MKKVAFLFVIIFFSTNSFSQKVIEEIVVTSLNKQDKTQPNFKNFERILQEFQKSNKIAIDFLKKDYIGVAFELSDENKQLDVFPARFTFDDEKISLSAIRSKSTGKPSEDMLLFTHKFINGDLDLGSTKIFKYILNNAPIAEGNYSEGENEYIIEEPLSLSFVRGNQDWMYVISIDNQYEQIDNPRILMYAFPISVGKPIFETNISKTQSNKEISDDDKEKFPLFHDFRTDDIRLGLENLIKLEPYKSNTELNKIVNVFNKKIDRYNVNEFVEQLEFILKLEISQSFLNKNFKLSRYKEDDPSGINDAVLNIKHIAAHALADINLNKNHELAIEYYKKSIFDFPLQSLSGTNSIKDMERCIFDISKAYYKAGKKDEAYAYLLGLIIDSDVFYQRAENQLINYIDTDFVDKLQLKKDIDKAVKSIKEEDENTYSLIFRQKKAFFIPLIPSTALQYSIEIQEKKFYKLLK